MSEFLSANETVIRVAMFSAVFAGMFAWEVAAPRRPRERHGVTRWLNNLALVVVDTLLLRLAFPILAVGFASYAAQQGWGLLALSDLPLWISFPVSIIVLDLMLYFQHVLFHAVPAFWRMHRTHHADREFDVTTGLRFHPVEVLLSMGIKFGVIAALGPPATAVLAFEVLLNAASMFNHGNVRMRPGLDRILRWMIVTPDMHRVHHSSRRHESNSNFGFGLPWWDRLLGTYRAQPQEAHDRMTIGIHGFRTHRDQWIDRMLISPLRTTEYDFPPSGQSDS